MQVECEYSPSYGDMLPLRNNNVNNLLEHVITFMPYEQFNSMWIMGDFTNWEPKEMTRSKDIFSYRTVLMKGFKYYFSFTAKDQVILDHNAEFENNPRFNQPNNFIQIIEEDSITPLPIFDYKSNYVILEEEKKKFIKAKMGDEKEILAFEKAIDFNKRYVERLNFLERKRQDVVNKIGKFYE